MQQNTANITKQTVWERRLLDLSLRNSLLNFRAGSSSVQLLSAGPAQLEDELSKEESFRLSPVPEDIALHETEIKIAETENVEALSREFRAKRIPTPLSASELEKTLKKLHRQSKASLEENGANTLYIALGFLRWYETKSADKARLAPLVLLPVELTRKIQTRSYSVKIRDEEPQINVTLLELLRQDFGITIPGLSPLPEDESGVNLKLVFDTVRQSVAGMERWEVVEAAFLGQFSFSRFIMWNDIHTRCDDLQESKVVASLIAGKMEWQAENAPLNARQLDENVLPSDMAIPASADSSQLSAIYGAAHGESFVLHGPPGTGKSQTITNMIANALYQKKTVLFVAEKMAALSVVQKRLEKLGLDPFCLELHSNKAQKKAVLSQLEKTLNVRGAEPPEGYAKTAEALLEKRRSLNETMTALHKKQPNGFSLYELLVMFEQNIDFKGKLTVPAEKISDVDFEQWLSAVRELALAEREAGGCGSGSPFRHIGWKSYTTEQRDHFKEAAERLASEAENAKNAYISAFGTAPTGIAIVRACAEGAAAVKGAEYILPLAAGGAELSARRPELEKIIADGKSLAKLNAELDAEFDAAVSGWNAAEALLKWRAAEQKWALPKAIEQGNLLKEMALYRKAGKPSPEQFAGGCERLSERSRLTDTLNGASSALTEYFGALWSGAGTDFERLERCFCESAALNEKLRPIRGTDQLETILSGKNSGALDAFTEALTRYEAAESELKTSYSADFTGIYGEAPCCFDAASAEAKNWLNNLNSLREHCSLMLAKKKAESLGLSLLTEPLFNGEISSEELEPALRCAFAYTAANRAISAKPSLSSFTGARFEDSIAKYREMTSEFENLTIKELLSRLSEKIPDISGTDPAGSSELGILLKAIKSKGRMMSLRRLFDSIPNLIRRLCPCMLMSPISVAQYIDPSFPKFDLIIFDEASQLPTSEAVGAIARGENAVIVGDPNQLPPTSFFNAEHFDEENAEIEDLESVLDDCLALAMPQRHLEWHYRSRHESLIAYSNSRYYDNSLKTFPSPDDLVSRVKWVHTGGFYDKSGTRQNLAEGQAVVAEICRRLSDERLRADSIGVVTFSLAQQILIDDLLAEEFRKNPELEAFEEQMHEPILVKNLENVQGDERDAILFSVGYGPDENGNVSMNFGPLNRDGGWRRLNVAITRARKEMLVFSTITPEQIDENRTSADGVLGLKGFLEFARRGSSALPGRTASAAEEYDGLAKLLSEEIGKMGYETRLGVGCSEYRVDVGVVNPDRPESYLLGIQCDGARHFSSGSARDRWIVQPGMLDGLGWKIENVRILDVFDDKEKVLRHLKSAIEEALRAFREAPTVPAAPSPQTPEPEPQKPQAPQVPQAPEPEPQTPQIPQVPQVPEPKPQAESKPAQKEKTNAETYRELTVGEEGTPDEFYEPKSLPKIRKLCEKIIAAETPVSRRALLKKTLDAFGISRTSAKAEKQFDEAISELCISATSSESGVFYWSGVSPLDYSLCRVPADGEKRAMDEICPQEIANGVKLILENQISMSREDLLRETARLFGHSRLSEAAETAAAEGIDAALRKGFVTEENGRISIKE